MKKKIEPFLSMDKWTRNERVYEFLLKMEDWAI